MSTGKARSKWTWISALAIAVTLAITGCAGAPSLEMPRLKAPAALPEFGSTPPVIGMLWVPGCWHWDGKDYVWIPGHWRSPPSAQSP